MVKEWISIRIPHKEWDKYLDKGSNFIDDTAITGALRRKS
jgi:hypothetical protein